MLLFYLKAVFDAKYKLRDFYYLWVYYNPTQKNVKIKAKTKPYKDVHPEK